LKKILHLLPFESLYPPLNGGMQRCFNLLLELSKYYNLTVLTFLDSDQITLMKNNHPELVRVNFITSKKIPDQNEISVIQRIRYAIISRFIDRNMLNKTNSNLLRAFFTIRAELINSHFDVIIIEQIDLIGLRNYFRGKVKKIVFDAHNFETELSLQKLKQKKIKNTEYLKIKSIESKLYKNIDILWTCSERDALLFRDLNKGIFLQIDVIPNGTRIPNLAKKRIENDHMEKIQKPIIIFVGSLDYKPNEEGLIWFIESVLPIISCDLEFRIIGSGFLSEKLKNIILNSERINLLGFVDNLDSHYIDSAVVVIPILSGSGTRLKVLESMSYGCAIVSTVKGAEGIKINNEIIIQNNPLLMAKSIQELIEKPDFRKEIGEMARSLVVESFDWTKVGQKINQSIERSFNIKRN
jgi:glycosyltransferase involved in cell wall biosynthesis